METRREVKDLQLLDQNLANLGEDIVEDVEVVILCLILATILAILVLAILVWKRICLDNKVILV